MMLTKQEVRTDLIRYSKIFHFGTLSSTHTDVPEATRFDIDTAMKSGAMLSFDPNLWEPLWKNLEHAKTEVEYGFSKCNLLKLSDNEIMFMFGYLDYDWTAKELLELLRSIADNDEKGCVKGDAELSRNIELDECRNRFKNIRNLRAHYLYTNRCGT